MTFSPVHEEQIEETRRFTTTDEPAESPVHEPEPVSPREIEVGPKPRIVPRKRLEIVHVSIS
jgi:hypothetical protein